MSKCITKDKKRFICDRLGITEDGYTLLLDCMDEIVIKDKSIQKLIKKARKIKEARKTKKVQKKY